ncbi:MAG: hypothetical protein ACRCX2_30275 [Paraclostridium sp.]
MNKKSVIIRLEEDKHSNLKMMLAKNKESMQSVLEKCIDQYIKQGNVITQNK